MSEVKTKVVNVRATIPVRNVNPPIYGTHTGITMTLSDILKCLCKRAAVFEVLPDGSTIRLNTKNFRDDHSGISVNKVKSAKTEIKPATPAVTIKTEVKEKKEVVENPVSDNDGFDFSMLKNQTMMEERKYSDGSTHLVIAGSQVILPEDDIDEEDAGEPEEPDISMEERMYSDGIIRSVPINACLTFSDSESQDGTVINTVETVKEHKVEKKIPFNAKSTKSNKKVSNKK